MKKYICVAMLCCISLTVSGCSQSKKNIAPEAVMEIPDNSSTVGISEAIGSTPSSQEINKKSGISADHYENYTFAGYNGKISFYYSDGDLSYYKWSYNTSAKDGDTVYTDVCTALAGTYGKGVEKNSDSLKTTTWEEKDKQVVAQKTSSGQENMEVSYMVVSK